MSKNARRPVDKETPASPENTARRQRRVRPQEKRPSIAGRQLRTRFFLGLAGIAVLAVALAIAYFLLTGSSVPVNEARLVADQGLEHVSRGQPHPPYNTIPPTSGWHYEKAAPWGIHDNPIDDETQVHNLEHGGIMIQYWCPTGCPDLVQQLKSVAGRYPSKVILAPYAKPLENRIALTAWNWIDTFDNFDEQRIVEFIDARVNRGPERVPD